MALMNSESWVNQSLCSKTKHVDFFPNNRDTEAVTKAKRVCSRCSVKDPCLDYAIDNTIIHGIWGGFTEDERRRIRPIRLLMRVSPVKPRKEIPKSTFHLKIHSFVLKVPN